MFSKKDLGAALCLPKAHLETRYAYLEFIVAQVDVLKERLGDTQQGLLGPLHKPVNGAAVHQGGKHATSCTERIPYWAHTQYDVEIVSAHITQCTKKSVR